MARRIRIALWRWRRAVLNRLDLGVAVRCALQSNRRSVRHTRIGNVPGWEAHYPSLAHFRHDIPAIVPRRGFDCLVAQYALDDAFVSEQRPKVFFTREPRPYLDESTRRLMRRDDLAEYLLRFDEEDSTRRQHYVSLPDDRGILLRRLRSGLRDRRPALACIVNRYKEDPRLPLLAERLRFVDAMADDIDIYGAPPRGQPNGWDRYPNYHGAVRNKRRTLRRYTFNLCFENCDEDGYITEKVVDALAAGCVPLYWGGGRYLKETIPADCFIDCRDGNPARIHARIRAMSHDEVVAYRRAGLAFLASPQADRFTRRYWADRVIERLQPQLAD